MILETPEYVDKCMENEDLVRSRGIKRKDLETRSRSVRAEDAEAFGIPEGIYLAMEGRNFIANQYQVKCLSHESGHYAYLDSGELRPEQAAGLVHRFISTGEVDEDSVI